MENEILINHNVFFRAIVGELDDEVDARLDLSTIRADPLSSIVH
jgi:hypothetical protein